MKSLIRTLFTFVLCVCGIAVQAETQATIYFGKFATGNSFSNPTYTWDCAASGSIGAVEIKVYTRSGSPGSYVYTTVGTRSASPTSSDSIVLTGEQTYYIKVSRCYTQDNSWQWQGQVFKWCVSRHDTTASHCLYPGLPSDGAIWWAYTFTLGSTYASSAWNVTEAAGASCPAPTAAEIWGQ